MFHVEYKLLISKYNEIVQNTQIEQQLSINQTESIDLYFISKQWKKNINKNEYKKS